MTEQTRIDTLAKVVFWPSPQDYCEALQTPQESLSCPELKAGEIELDNMGLPRPISGGFASVYKVVTANAERAIRCFLLKRADQHERYTLISEHINSNPLPYTVDFDYIADGIKVANSWFPIVDMDWVQGETLDQYLRTHYQDTAIVSELLNQFVEMMKALRSAGIAHGDLQHGNILVMQDRSLKLVDYDGMFVSSMSGMQSCELGHRNYQHPMRTSAHFDKDLDNFSALTIFTTLKAIEADPKLVDRLDALNECSLFRASDFKDPLASKAFHVLERHKNEELGKLSRLIRQYLEKDPSEVPALADLPSEPDEYIFSLSTISADLLSPDFLYAEQGDEGTLAEELVQAETELQTATNLEKTTDQATPLFPGSLLNARPVQSKAGTLSSNVAGTLILLAMIVWVGMMISLSVTPFIPADRSELPLQFGQVFTTPLRTAKVLDYSKSKGMQKSYEFTVESAEPLKIRDEQDYRSRAVNGAGNVYWARTAFFRDRLSGNISILMDSTGTKAHVDIAKPALFAVTRDGVNLDRAMNLADSGNITVVEKSFNDQFYEEDEAKGLTVDHSGVSLCKSIDPKTLNSAEFESEIRSYIRKLQSAPVDRESLSHPRYVLKLVIPDRSLSNDQIKVLENISAELNAAAPDKPRPDAHQHQLWLHVIVPVESAY
ncbi:MAG: hypothetical protein K2W95_13790 [Candidatus Obscuribacterales bacterium]|nr:hypothetical protein [Candidatus Obscuribacterales bacterium]